MKIVLGDLIAKMQRGNIFKPMIRNKSLHQDSNDNGVRKLNFATSKSLFVKNTMFPCQEYNVPMLNPSFVHLDLF